MKCDCGIFGNAAGSDDGMKHLWGSGEMFHLVCVEHSLFTLAIRGAQRFHKICNEKGKRSTVLSFGLRIDLIEILIPHVPTCRFDLQLKDGSCQ
jgi:hypothetical protein